MTVSGLNILFDHLSYLLTLSDQAVNVSSVDDFTPDFYSCLLLYHRCCPRLSLRQAVNVSSIDKPTDCHSCSTSLSMSSQTSVDTDTPRSHNPRSCYFYYSRHHFNIADSLKIINQELLQLKDWVLPTVPDLQEKFAELPTIDISMIGAAPFNMLVQQASYAKNMEIFSILIRNIKKALAPKSTTNPTKKLPTEYHDFFDVFFQADSNILPLHHPYDHKIPLMEEKTPPWSLLYSMSQDKLKVLKKYLEKNLSKGFIRASSSPALSHVFFASKPEGGLQFCID